MAAVWLSVSVVDRPAFPSLPRRVRVIVRAVPPLGPCGATVKEPLFSPVMVVVPPLTVKPPPEETKASQGTFAVTETDSECTSSGPQMDTMSVVG